MTTTLSFGVYLDFFLIIITIPASTTSSVLYSSIIISRKQFQAKFDIFPANRESLFVQNCVLSASKLATLLNPTSPQAEKDMVLKIGKDLLKAAFEKARKENSLSILNNTIVLSLGLIKVSLFLLFLLLSLFCTCFFFSRDNF